MANCESCIHRIGGWDVEYGYDCELLKYGATVKGENYCEEYQCRWEEF